tara:strand:+ start:1084 stop:1716 length:633 start_codon:yes stop_codon:yes gene_type:complete
MGTRCNVIFYDSRMTTKETIEKQINSDVLNTSPTWHFSILYRHWDGYDVGREIREERFFEQYNQRRPSSVNDTRWITGSPLTHMVSSFLKWSFYKMKKKRMDRFLSYIGVKNTWDIKKIMLEMTISDLDKIPNAMYDLTYDWTKMGDYEITNCIHDDIEYLWWVDVFNQEVEGFHKTYNVTDWKEREKYKDYSWTWKVVETMNPENYGVA